jgi:hypothetical protein
MTFNDPLDAVTAAFSERKDWLKEVKIVKYELVSARGIFMFESINGKKLKAWAKLERIKLPKCSCGKIFGKEIFKSRASPKLMFCGTLCSKRDEAEKPMSDNDETEFEI